MLTSLVRRSIASILAALLLVLPAAPVAAKVQITFYSKEFGASFPHAYVVLEGTLDRTGERIAEDYGFSAKTVSPAILMGRVKGQVISDHSESYVKGSERHFTVSLSDHEYDRVMETIGKWRAARQPSYDLNRANCVHFVAELASAIGMSAAPQKGMMKKPNRFLQSITKENTGWLAARGAILHRPSAS